MREAEEKEKERENEEEREIKEKGKLGLTRERIRRNVFLLLDSKGWKKKMKDEGRKRMKGEKGGKEEKDDTRRMIICQSCLWKLEPFELFTDHFSIFPVFTELPIIFSF